MSHTNPSDDVLRELLTAANTIAVVGASANPDRPSHGAMRFLLETGFRVIPVTPNAADILGRRAYPSLGDIPEPVDIVDVFRRAEFTPAIADEAVKIRAKVLWLQLGISNRAAAVRAEAGGLVVVMDQCIMETALRLRVKKRADEGGG